jgi:hypothetical protein
METFEWNIELLERGIGRGIWNAIALTWVAIANIMEAIEAQSLPVEVGKNGMESVVEA